MASQLAAILACGVGGIGLLCGAVVLSIRPGPAPSLRSRAVLIGGGMFLLGLTSVLLGAGFST